MALPEAGPRPLGAPATPGAVPGGVLTSRDAPSFDVHLEVYTGPFDLLLGLIARRRLDVTEVALAQVTDEFVAHLRRAGAEATARGDEAWHLGQATGFLVVAATLLDLKAARLLPSGEVEDEEDLALLEARDLLFARLLQHRAYSEVAAVMGQRMAASARSVPRAVPLEAEVASALPELVWTTTPAQLAALALAAMAPRRVPAPVDTAHLHAPSVSVPEQVELVTALLVAAGTGVCAPFAELAAGAGSTAEVVGRFLAVLELYRRGLVELAQESPLEGLAVRWAGP